MGQAGAGRRWVHARWQAGADPSAGRTAGTTQSGAAQHNTAQHSTAQHSAAQRSTQHSTAQQRSAPSMRKGTRFVRSTAESRAAPVPASVVTSSSPCRHSVMTAWTGGRRQGGASGRWCVSGPCRGWSMGSSSHCAEGCRWAERQQPGQLTAPPLALAAREVVVQGVGQPGEQLHGVAWTEGGREGTVALVGWA